MIKQCIFNGVLKADIESQSLICNGKVFQTLGDAMEKERFFSVQHVSSTQSLETHTNSSMTALHSQGWNRLAKHGGLAAAQTLCIINVKLKQNNDQYTYIHRNCCFHVNLG